LITNNIITLLNLSIMYIVTHLLMQNGEWFVT
jgi:hypothetical protein